MPILLDESTLKLMKAHSDLVDSTKTEGRQVTIVGGTWAIWEYQLNKGLGPDRFCHQVVDSDLTGLSKPPAMSASQ